ncbi:MAG: TIGR04438 family Trp-rich protein [Pseudomonadota bacterium]|nr:TIGR04438 family Trp-rich protein [Pseudomonadota bacterium]
MYLLGLGIILLLMKWLLVGPVADWSWWVVLSPFALAVVWWAWADWSGYTKRKAMEKEDQRKQDRINRHREATGQKPRAGARRR